MARNWEPTRLGDLISLRGGLSYKGEFIDKGEGFLVGMGCVSYSERFLIDGGRRYGGEYSETHRLRPGDLVIATRQQSDNLPILGFPAMVPETLRDRDVIVATNLYKVTNNSGISNRFLYWLLRSSAYQNRILACAKGTTVRMLTKDAIEDFHFLCPPPTERDAITRILDSLDNKIDLNRRMNATLEAMARALFQSWFVDFDPVRAKASGRKPVGIDEVTAALFPDSFQESDLDDIPRGWRKRPLSELCGYLSRGIGPSYCDTGGVLVLNQKCIRDHRINFDLGRRHNDQKKTTSGRLLETLDILVNSTGTGTLGRVAQVLDIAEPMIVDSHVTVVRPAADVDPYFLGVNLIGREAEIEELAEGSTGQTELSRIRLGAMKVVTPTTALQVAFGRFAKPLFERIAKNDSQTRTLASLRDTLLPKLLGGELSVPLAKDNR